MRSLLMFFPLWLFPAALLAADEPVNSPGLGSVDAPPAKIVLRDGRRKVLATGRTPTLKAPLDLHPKTATVSLTLPAGIDWKGGSVMIEPRGQSS